MVARRKRKGPCRKEPKRLSKKRILTVPAKITMESEGGKLGVNIYRTDRDTPHSLAISFHIDPETVHSGNMCIVVYSTLREAMRNLLPKPQGVDKDRGKRRSKPCRIPEK